MGRVPYLHGIWHFFILSLEDNRTKISQKYQYLQSDLQGERALSYPVVLLPLDRLALQFKKSSSFTSVEDLCIYAGCFQNRGAILSAINSFRRLSDRAES